MPLGYNAGEVILESMTVAEDETLSAGVNLEGKRLLGFVTPAGYDGGVVTLYTSTDGVTFDKIVYDMYGTAVTFTPTVGHYTYVDPIITAGLRSVAFKAASAVGDDYTFTLITREV